MPKVRERNDDQERAIEDYANKSHEAFKDRRRKQGRICISLFEEELEKLKVKLDRYIDKVNDLEVNQGKVESLLSEVSKNQDRNKNLVMTIIGAILVAAIMGGLAFRLGGA